jgi:hypothetical protein
MTFIITIKMWHLAELHSAVKLSTVSKPYMLSVIMLSVVMLSVVAPFDSTDSWRQYCKKLQL